MDLLSDILSHLQLSGTLYFRTSFTSPWSIRVPAFENVARFHYADKGRCLVRVGAEPIPVALEQGDLIIIMRGATHTLYCDPANENRAVQLDQVVEHSGYDGTGALVYGGEFGTHHETQLVCGHFSFANNVSHMLIDALPPYIHIRNYGETSGRWMENTLRVIGNEVGRAQMGGDLIGLKMSEIIFAQALRDYLDTEGADRPVLSGFSNPNIARVLTEVHKDPAHPWTLGELAKVAGLSRTSFAMKFVKCMLVTPMGYITNWRMQLASQKLLKTDDPIIKIAEEVGYQSEAAFGRVFKKHHAIAPATYRRSA